MSGGFSSWNRKTYRMVSFVMKFAFSLLIPYNMSSSVFDGFGYRGSLLTSNSKFEEIFWIRGLYHIAYVIFTQQVAYTS